MKICFFGIYDSAYSRNRVLISGFRENGYEVVECSADPRVYTRISKYFELYKEYKKIKGSDFKYVVVAFPGHTVVWLARLLFGKNIIFDAFVSLYNSEVEDRKSVPPWHPRALYYWLLDFFSCRMAQKILLDTNAHISYFVERYHIQKNKFIRVFVGTTPKDFYPIAHVRKNNGKFIAHFHGTFIPLQGIEYIVRAAKLLEDDNEVVVRIIGTGQEYERVHDVAERLGVRNIEFIGRASLHDLNSYINDADVCLGIFGDTNKTPLVIPNKVYEAFACGKPVITADTPAMREITDDGKGAVLIPCADVEAISFAIRKLKNDAVFREHLGNTARVLFQEQFTPKQLARKLLSEII